MSTGYHRGYPSGGGDSPGWTALMACLGLIFCIVALPAVIIGVAAQLFTRRYPWSKHLWLILTLVSFALTYYQFQYSNLNTLLTNSLAGYILSIKYHLFDITQYNWKALWGVTYPPWFLTWTLIGIVGCWQELHYNQRYSSAAKQLKAQARRRQTKLERGMRKARKRTQRPEHLPDQIGGMMTMGVPINDEEDE